MRTHCFLLVTALLIGCRTREIPATPPATPTPASPPTATQHPMAAGAEGPSYSGGEGASHEQAVIIKGAKNEEVGVAAEYAWLRKRYPGYRTNSQSASSSDGKHYDMIEITTPEGIKRVYFDITDFYGKW